MADKGSIRQKVNTNYNVAESQNTPVKNLPPPAEKLVKRKINRVLLVGSRYDAFMLKLAGMENGDFTAQAISKPTFFRCSTGQSAIEFLRKNEPDIVISDLKLRDMDAFFLAQQLAGLRLSCPVVVVTGDPRYAGPNFAIPERRFVDKIFIWDGKPELINAIVQLYEDKANAVHDLTEGKIRCILVVEDEARYYSRLILAVYREIEAAHRRVLQERRKIIHPEMVMKTRAKVLHAEAFEEAIQIVDAFGENLAGVVTDVQFPKEGILDARAGLELTSYVKSRFPAVPVVVQSAQEELASVVEEIGAAFVSKKSKLWLHELQKYMRDYFGLGNFIFRLPSGQVVGEASSLEELREALEKIPIESFVYHGANNHFSTWLYLHGDYELAQKLRPIDVGKTRDEWLETRKRVLKIIDDYIKTHGIAASTS